IMNEFLVGIIAALSLVIGMFFFRFWRKTHDRFFLFFALSFLIEACNRALMVSVSGWQESSPSYYMIRLLAYTLIILAILDKNRKKA
ncbi:MAG TPA: DUF5985 family protein, partial [Methylophilaceae bacterium]|nr:DUF5985 family protein [Methylophilaceae bacterium]